MRSIRDLPRPGRPARIPVHIRCKLVQLACERPDEKRTAFRDVWTYQALADALWAETGIRISVSEVGRILRFEKLRPHRVQQWLHSPDKAFIEKAEVICGLYHGERSGAVVCVDEKPLVVRSRKYPAHVGPGAVLRRDFEYRRHGTGCLIAAFDVHTGKVFGRVEPNRKATTLVDFMEGLAERYPTGPVTVVWDNLNIHYDGKDKRWLRFNERHGFRFRFVYTPIHASWLNQVEIWFSIVHRRVIQHADYTTLAAMRTRILGFIQRWNEVEGHPFRWTWRTDRLQTQTRQAA